MIQNQFLSSSGECNKKTRYFLTLKQNIIYQCGSFKET